MKHIHSANPVSKGAGLMFTLLALLLMAPALQIQTAAAQDGYQEPVEGFSIRFLEDEGEADVQLTISWERTSF